MTEVQQRLGEAMAAYQAGDFAGAERRCDAVLAQAPESARAFMLKSIVHARDEAAVRLALLESAVAADPADPEAWYNLGVLRAETGDADAALEAYARAVALDPFMRDALGNGGEILRRREEFSAALDWIDRQFLAPGASWTAHLNRAICLLHLRRLDEADLEFETAIAQAGDAPIAHWERFALLLFQKRFGEAWDAYERRFACGPLNGVFCYPFPQPLWTGQPLAGRHILIHNEQGLGDQIMHACALPEVAAQAARVTLVAAPTLCALFAASFPGVRVLPARYGDFPGDHPPPPWLGSLGEPDVQAPIGSLMAVLRRRPESFDRKPYLRPSEDARARWRDFDPGSGLKVGICWASNPALFRSDSARRAQKKSVPLETLAPLASLEGVRLVSVLNWPIRPAPERFAGRLTDVSARLTSMDETAALIERLDLVITVDTAVAHLAGAMGKETWLMLHDFPDCRWELEADRSYWYRDMTLIRQAAPGDWEGVAAEVGRRLAARVGP